MIAQLLSEFQQTLLPLFVFLYFALPRLYFPLLRGTHITLIILDILGALKFFDLSYVLTDGGPAHATETFSTYIYTKSFSTFQQGQASTIVVYMFLIAMVLTVIQLKIYYKKDKKEMS